MAKVELEQAFSEVRRQHQTSSQTPRPRVGVGVARTWVRTNGDANARPGAGRRPTDGGADRLRRHRRSPAAARPGLPGRPRLPRGRGDEHVGFLVLRGGGTWSYSGRGSIDWRMAA